MQRNETLRFNDRHPIGLFGGVIFISAATLFNAVIWGLGTQPNLTASGKTALLAVRLAVTAFTLLFYYGGLEMLFGSYSAEIDLTNKVIRYRQRPPPVAKRSVIPLSQVNSVLIEPRTLSGPFTKAAGFGIFILADQKLFISETRTKSEALTIAHRVADTLATPIQDNTEALATELA